MAGDNRNLLNLLESELRFVELGGYDSSSNSGWVVTSPFRDSLTCPNFGREVSRRSCHNCHLLAFVLAEHLLETTPCHFIPLGDRGETIAELRPVTAHKRLIHMVKVWLRWKINQLRLECEPSSPPLMKGGETC